MKNLLLISLTWIIPFLSFSQPYRQMHSSEILQKMKRINKLGTVLYIAAHPDDENTRLLAYLNNELNLKTGYLSLTRGDGGQNLIGKEQGEPLGLIRTHELLGARSMDGAEQFFTRANDFGFSKTPDETLRIWNKDSILGDMVWVIRNFRPDVIICRFPTTGEGGHGHHTASALLALEAADAAADPVKFTQQLKYTQPWKTRRVFWNTFNFGSTNTTSADQLKVDVGGYNPLLGKSYGEIAAESRSMHKSQGFGSAKNRGSNLEYFKQLKGDSVLLDLFEGIDQTWKRTGSIKDPIKPAEKLIEGFDPASPEKSLPSLMEIYDQIRMLPEDKDEMRFWKKVKLQELESLILQCSGLWMESFATENRGIPGGTINLTAQVLNRSKGNVVLQKITFQEGNDTLPQNTLKENEMFTCKRKIELPSDLPYSNPYWLNEEHSDGLYKVTDPMLIGKPEMDPLLKIRFQLQVSGKEFVVERPVVNKTTDPVKGEIYRLVEILPPATINFSDKVYVFKGKEPRKIQVVVKSNIPDLKGELNIKATNGWIVNLEDQVIDLKEQGAEKTILVNLIPGSVQESEISAEIITQGRSYSLSQRNISYDHIPSRIILQDAKAKLVSMQIETKGNKIGYITGAGDDVPSALRQIGYQVTILTDEILEKCELQDYDCIITGIRAHNTHERLQHFHPALMEYIKKGGNMIVQYNTNNRIGPVIAKIGPYPFNITRDRVTVENAEVRVLKPEHPVMNFPNNITDEDFNGWIQERGIYFAGEPDPKFVSILSMNDPGEKESQGSLIIAPYGKGNFVYTGLAFFRQLPAGNPGAYRLFSNLISLPENDK